MTWLNYALVFVQFPTFFLIAEAFKSNHAGNHGHHSNYKKNEIAHYVPRNNHVSRSFHARNEDHFSIAKKAEIEGAIKNIETTSDKKDKRGFLASLANLLNDAEAISGHKNSESGLSSVTLTAKDHSTVEGSSKTSDTTKKEEIVPTTDDIQKALKDSPKDFAPIFAMFHGKIIPLGKLPDTAFKKSKTEFPQPVDTSNTLEKHSEVVETTGTKKEQISTESALQEKMKSAQITKLSKLQRYLKNLDGHIPATGASKDVKGSVKDEVVFPDQEPGSPKSEILSHVKGVVLDNGKVVSVNNNHIEGLEETAKQTETVPESQQKFIVSEDGSLTPIAKSKSETTVENAVARDTTSGPEGQKTVALSLDVLKDLLKKTDNKISLASLLNKNAETKSDTPEEDEDPGTIEDFAASGLKSHNMYRVKHHDEALIWSDDLAAKAQKLAEALADKKTLEIAKDLEKEGYGENVAKVWATFKNAGEAATKMWYSQSENYRFDDPHLDENTGQFAQLIWKNTRELGMGVAKSIDDVNNKYVYVTALYKPPGNIEATLRQNVLPTGNNTVDVYTTFFKRGGVVSDGGNVKRSKLQAKPKSASKFVDDED